MFLSLDQIVNLLLFYKYLILFPIIVIEGPITTIIAGFLASLGTLNLTISYIVIVTADLAGDSIYYAIGFFSRKNFIQKWWRLIGITPDRLKNLEDHFEKHQFKTLIIGKITHAVGAIVLVAAGMAKVPYKKFILFNLLATIPKSLILILVGFYFGHAYKKLDRILDYSAFVIFFAVVLFILVYFLTKKLAKLLDNSKEQL